MLSKFDVEMEAFSKRIVRFLDLYTSTDYESRKEILKWTSKEQARAAAEIERIANQKTSSFLPRFLQKSKQSPTKEGREHLEGLEELAKLAALTIPTDYKVPQSLKVPATIIEHIELLRGKELSRDFYEVRGPLIGLQYCRNDKVRQLMNQKEEVAGLRFNRVGPELVQSYQRIFIRELFGRIFRKRGVLSIVIQLLPNKESGIGSPTYFLVEDLPLNKDTVVPLENIVYNADKHQLVDSVSSLNLSTESLLEEIFSELMTLPIQTTIPRFVCVREANELFLTRWHPGPGDIGKGHPSLRTPLLFFREYFQTMDIDINKVLHVSSREGVYLRYFTALQILLDLQKDDFYVVYSNDMKPIPSATLSHDALQTISDIFHRLVVLEKWLLEVVKPIKNSIKFRDVIQQIWPILNEINVIQAKDIREYSSYVQRLEIDTFLSEEISKPKLKQYLEAYQVLSVEAVNKEFLASGEFLPVPQQIRQLFWDRNIEDFPIGEAVHLMQFYLQNTPNLEGSIPQSWRQLNFWKRVFRYIDHPSVNIDFIDVNMEICPYYLGFDPVHLSLRDSFALLVNTKESEGTVQKLEMYANYLVGTYPQVASDRLILLFEKCLHHEKLKFGKLLLKYNVGRFNLDFLFRMVSSEKVLPQDKDEFLNKIEASYPQTFRRYKWEEIFRVHLNVQKQGISLHSFDFGEFYLNEEQLGVLLKKNGTMHLELDCKGISRNDYMYTLDRGISKLRTDKFEFYVERVELPGVDYFFSKVLDVLKAHYIKPLTTYVVLHDTYLQCTESLSDGFSIPQASKTFLEDEITNLVDRSILSQAIIISFLLYPMRVSFDDIILRKEPRMKELFHLYIKSIYCYSSYAQTKDGKSSKLRVQNALFLLDMMEENVPIDVVEKYATMDVLGKVRSIFNLVQQFDQKATALREKLSNQKGSFVYDLPFLGVPFEKDFIVQLTYRFLLISETFKSVLANKSKHISHTELFEKMDPPVAYFYKKVKQSSKSLLTRWDLLSKLEAKGKGFVGRGIFQFYSSFTWWEQPEDSDFPNDLNNLKFIGPSQSLKLLSDNQHKSQVFLQKDPEALKSIMRNAPTAVASFFMRNIDLSAYPPAIQDDLISIYAQISKRYQTNPKKHSALQGLNLLGCTILEPKHYALFSYERVQHITLQRCEKLIETDLAELANRLPCLVYLKLNQIKGLQCFSSKRSFAVIHELPLAFKSLKTLIIRRCDQLTLIDVTSPALSNIDISFNSKLESIFAVSPEIKNLNSFANPELRLENIAIYILQGVNVLIDDASGRGQFARLFANHDPTRDSYTQKICRLFASLVGRFDQGQVRNNLLVSMFKTKLLDGGLSNEIFTVYSALVTRYITTNIKLTPKLEDDLLTNLIKCFYRNPRVTEIYLDDFQSLDDKLKTKALSRFVTCLNEVSKSTPVFYKSIHLSKVLSQHTLKLLVETSKYLRKENTLDLFISNAHESQLYVEIVRNLCCVGTLQRLKLIVQKTIIGNNLLIELFRACSTQLVYIRLEECQLQIDSTSELKLFADKCKTLVLKNCEIQGNFDISQRLTNVNTIQIEGGVVGDFEGLLNSLTGCKQLTNLSLKGLIVTSADLISLVGYLENNKLDYLDISGSIFTNTDMQMLDRLFEHLTIKQLVLQNIQVDQHYDLSKFLANTKYLKKLSMASDNVPQIGQFMRSLGANRSINSFELSCDGDYVNLQLQPLRENTELETFVYSHRLPLWLVSRLEENTRQKMARQSTIIDVTTDDFTEIVHLNSKNKQDCFKIGLSLDGGGMRGLMLASELQYLSNQTKKPLHKMFDCIGGTSIGGILALSITGTKDHQHPVCDQNEIINIFEHNGSEIFKRSNTDTFTRLFGSRYPATGIEGVLNSYFGNCKLSDVLPGTSVIVTSVKRQNNRVKIFKSKEAILNRNKDFWMRDVGRATSAAPTYFPAAEIKNIDATRSYSLVDGGLGLNNPSKLVIDEIKKSAINQGAEDNFFLLSLGTGRVADSGVPMNAGLKDVSPVIDSFAESSNYFIERDIAQNYKGHYLRVSPVFNCAKKDLELDNTSNEIMRLYRKQGQDSAVEYFSNLSIFGPFHDRSLVEWFAENTDRKFQMI